MQYWLFLALPRTGVLPCALPAQLGRRTFTKDYCSDLRAYSWEQKKLSLGFGLLHFPFAVKIEKICIC